MKVDGYTWKSVLVKKEIALSKNTSIIRDMYRASVWPSWYKQYRSPSLAHWKIHSQEEQALLIY